MVLVMVMMLLLVSGVSANEPRFRIEHGNVVHLNMTISQEEDDDPDDSLYYIESPLTITVSNESGPVYGATVSIIGPNTDITNTTDVNGNMTYAFNLSEITRGGQQIVVRASHAGYQYDEEKIYVDYLGILSVSRTDTYSYIDIDRVGLSAEVDYVDMYMTPTIIDLKNNDLPVEGANVTLVVSSVSPVSTTVTWEETGDGGAGSGTSATIPQYRFTDADGKVRFVIKVDRSDTTDKSSITLVTNVEKQSYAPVRTESNSDVESNEACFIATATYGTPENKNLNTLRAFRDELLIPNPVGKTLVKTYYLTSPPIAYALSQSDGLRAATRVSLITPSVYFAKILLNPVALIGIVIGLALSLIMLKNQRKSILKGIGHGTLTIFAFMCAVFTFGYLGYTTPIYAVIGAYLLPIMIPAALCVAVLGGSKEVRTLIKTSN